MQVALFLFFFFVFWGFVFVFVFVFAQHNEKLVAPFLPDLPMSREDWATSLSLYVHCLGGGMHHLPMTGHVGGCTSIVFLGLPAPSRSARGKVPGISALPWKRWLLHLTTAHRAIL